LCAKFNMHHFNLFNGFLIPWNPKVFICCFRHLVRKGIFFLQDFAYISELHILQALRQHRACQILILYELEVIEIGRKFNFLEFFEKLLNAATWQTLSKGCRTRCQKKVCFTYRILDFHFLFVYFFKWFHLM
jgi:hypothetical protein